MASPLPLVAKLEQQKELAEWKLAQLLREVSAGVASSSLKKRVLRARKTVEKLRGRLRRISGTLSEHRSSSARRQAGTKADRRTSDRGNIYGLG